MLLSICFIIISNQPINGQSCVKGKEALTGIIIILIKNNNCIECRNNLQCTFYFYTRVINGF